MIYVSNYKRKFIIQSKNYSKITIKNDEKKKIAQKKNFFC